MSIIRDGLRRRCGTREDHTTLAARFTPLPAAHGGSTVLLGRSGGSGTTFLDGRVSLLVHLRSLITISVGYEFRAGISVHATAAKFAGGRLSTASESHPQLVTLADRGWPASWCFQGGWPPVARYEAFLR